MCILIAIAKLMKSVVPKLICGYVEVSLIRELDHRRHEMQHDSPQKPMRASRRSLSASMVTICTMMFSTPLSARENTLDLINALRTRDCTQPLSSTQTLHASAGLDVAAKELMAGRKIDDALKRTDFRVTRSAVIHISGDIDDASLEQVLGNSHCGPITDPGLTAIGIARDTNGITIVLAAPFSPPATEDASKISREVLQLVNQARARPRRCGAQRFAAVPPLVLSEKLSAAAATQANDMAEVGFLSHQGSDESNPADRVARAGYPWQTVGENVAAGPETANDVVEGWLSSPGHCVNIMSADFTETGIAYASNPKQEMGIYWTQVFARPKQ